MTNFSKRPDRECKPHLIFNSWLKKHYEDKNQMVKAVMLGLYLIDYKQVPMAYYYDSDGNQKYQIEFEYDMTGDGPFDKSMELADLYYEEYKQYGYTDSLHVYTLLNVLYYLDEYVCKAELINILKQRRNFANPIPTFSNWVLDLAKKLHIII